MVTFLMRSTKCSLEHHHNTKWVLVHKYHYIRRPISFPWIPDSMNWNSQHLYIETVKRNSLHVKSKYKTSCPKHPAIYVYLPKIMYWSKNGNFKRSVRTQNLQHFHAQCKILPKTVMQLITLSQLTLRLKTEKITYLLKIQSIEAIIQLFSNS